MKTRSTPEEMSRRQFAKLVSGAVFVASTVAVPVAGEEGQKGGKKSSLPQTKSSQTAKILTHIPPIDLMNGSFIVRSNEELSEAIDNDHPSGGQRPKKHQCSYGEVKWVRIIAANGDLIFDGYKNNKADRAQIEVLFTGISTDPAQIMIRKEDNSQHITFETKQKLDNDGMSSSGFRRHYHDSTVQIKHVRIKKSGADPLVYTSDDDQQIEHIKVWTYE